MNHALRAKMQQGPEIWPRSDDSQHNRKTYHGAQSKRTAAPPAHASPHLCALAVSSFTRPACSARLRQELPRPELHARPAGLFRASAGAPREIQPTRGRNPCRSGCDGAAREQEDGRRPWVVSGASIGVSCGGKRRPPRYVPGDSSDHVNHHRAAECSWRKIAKIAVSHRSSPTFTDERRVPSCRKPRRR